MASAFRAVGRILEGLEEAGESVKENKENAYWTLEERTLFIWQHWDLN
jgi:hypothetical protein